MSSHDGSLKNCHKRILHPVLRLGAFLLDHLTGSLHVATRALHGFTCRYSHYSQKQCSSKNFLLHLSILAFHMNSNVTLRNRFR